MKKLTVLLLSSCFCFSGCDQQTSGNEEADTLATNTSDTARGSFDFNTVTLEKVWETDTTLLTSESVLYDKEGDRVFVSNINGNPTEKDGNGFIAMLNKQGEVRYPTWFSGSLDAPKGMAISNGKLYVTDIDRLLAIDLENQISNGIWQIDTAKFLNDVAAGPDGTIYFSDSQTNTIYSLKDSTVSVFLSDAKLNSPNGIHISGDSVMMVTTMGGGELLRINLDDQSIENVATGIGAGDGIVSAGNNQFIASSWNGQVFLINENGETKNLLDTRSDSINSADIEYIQEENLLLVPTFGDNRVVAYKLSSKN